MSKDYFRFLRFVVVACFSMFIYSCAIGINSDDLRNLMDQAENTSGVPSPSVSFNVVDEESGEVTISLPDIEGVADAKIYWTYCSTEDVKNIVPDFNNTKLYDGPITIGVKALPEEGLALMAFAYLPEKGLKSDVAIFYLEKKEEQAAVFIGNSAGTTQFSSFDKEFEVKIGTNNPKYNRILFAFRGDLSTEEMFNYDGPIKINLDVLKKYGSFAADGLQAKLYLLGVACTEDMARCVKTDVVYYYKQEPLHSDPVIQPNGGVFLDYSFDLVVTVTHPQQEKLKALICKYSDSNGKSYEIAPCPSKEKPLVLGKIGGLTIQITANAIYPDGVTKVDEEKYEFKKEIITYYDPIISPAGGSLANGTKVELSVSHPTPDKVEKFECSVNSKPDSFQCPTKEFPFAFTGTNEKITFTAKALYKDGQIKIASSSYEFKVVTPNPTIILVEPTQPPFTPGKDVVVIFKPGVEGSTLLYAIDKDPMTSGIVYDGNYVKVGGLAGETHKIVIIEKYKDGSFSQQVALAISFEGTTVKIDPIDFGLYVGETKKIILTRSNASDPCVLMYAVCENIDGCAQPDLSTFIKGDAFDVTMKEGTAATYIWAGCKNNDGSWTKISFGKVMRLAK